MSVLKWVAGLIPGSDLLDPNAVRAKQAIRVAAFTLLFLSALAVRLLYYSNAEAELYGIDQERYRVAHFYHEAAASIVEGNDRMVFPRDLSPEITLPAGYPPGYFVFMAALYRVFGTDMSVVLIAQCLIDALSVVLLAMLGEALFSLGVGVAAGACMALSPQFAYLSLVVKPDTLTVLPVLVAMVLLVRGVRLRQVSAFVLAGIALGVACWLRQNALLLTPLLAMGALAIGDWRSLWRGALAMLIVCVAFVAPITARNMSAYGEPIPVAFGSGFALLSGLARDDYAGRYGLSRFAYNFTMEEAEARGLPPDYFIERYEEAQAGVNRPFEVKHSVLSVFAIDGIARDKVRTARAITLIRSDPFYYASICTLRVGRMLGYTEQRRLVPSTPRGDGRAFEASFKQYSSATETARYAVRTLQSPFQSRFILPIAFVGLVLIGMAGWRRSLLLVSIPVYYLSLQSLMWAEFRHALPIHITLFIAIGVVVAFVFRAFADRWGKFTQSRKEAKDAMTEI